MKSLSIYLSVFLILALSCDKEDIAPTRADQFIKHYGTGLNDAGIQVITTENGYLVLGSIQTENQGKDICILKTDKFGNTSEAIKTYGGLFDDVAYKIISNTGGYLIAGATQRSENSDWDIYLLQLAPDASLIWEKSYNYAYDNEAYDVLIRDNGNIVCTGYTKNAENNSDILYFETTASGDSIHFNQKGNAMNEVAYAVVELPDDLFLFAGYHESQNAENNIPGIYLLKWNGRRGALPQGDIKPGISSIVKCLIPGNNSNYLMACEVQPDLSGKSEIYLYSISETMTINWSQSHGAGKLETVNQLSLRDNQLYFCGTTSGNTNGGSMYLAQTSLDGTDPELLYSGENGSFTARGFDFCSDGGYILTGAASINNNSTMVLSKLTPEGGL